MGRGCRPELTVSLFPAVTVTDTGSETGLKLELKGVGAVGTGADALVSSGALSPE